MLYIYYSISIYICQQLSKTFLVINKKIPYTYNLT
ncbi:hypothetical protein [Staphylococcus phage vB_ScaM-V1SC04]|nr:hypothetical protein [Staphylococcus phage vB_ScaM-V1SC04]